MCVFFVFIFSMFNTPRLKKELSQLFDKPPFGIKVYIKDNSTHVLEAGKNYIIYF